MKQDSQRLIPYYGTQIPVCRSLSVVDPFSLPWVFNPFLRLTSGPFQTIDLFIDDVPNYPQTPHPRLYNFPCVVQLVSVFHLLRPYRYLTHPSYIQGSVIPIRI